MGIQDSSMILMVLTETVRVGCGGVQVDSMVVHSWDENIAVVVVLPSSAKSDDTEVAKVENYDVPPKMNFV
jgi:hypothetical protein